jgi:hypothetical protein
VLANRCVKDLGLPAPHKEDLDQGPGSAPRPTAQRPNAREPCVESSNAASVEQSLEKFVLEAGSQGDVAPPSAGFISAGNWRAPRSPPLELARPNAPFRIGKVPSSLGRLIARCRERGISRLERGGHASQPPHVASGE